MVNEKLYALKGTATKIYEPREVPLTFGGKKVVKYVSDMYLTLASGSQVKVSFWDTDISQYKMREVSISSLAFKGKYKDMAQYSSTKHTQISAIGGEEAPEEEAPDVEFEEEQAPEGAEEEATAPVKTAKVSTAYVVDPKAIEQTVTLAEVAMDIAQKVAVDIVKKDPVAFQALFATIFINLGLKDHHAKTGSR